MNKSPALFFVLALLMGSLFHSQAEPLNLLVGDLHFVRPEKWTWRPPPSNSSAKTSMGVRASDRDAISALVFFHEGPKNPPEAYNAWKRRFPDPASSGEAQSEQKIINDRSVTYFELTGPYVFGGERHNNHTLLGAVIPSVGKFVHVLLIGPAAEVRNAKADFKNMIESALLDAD